MKKIIKGISKKLGLEKETQTEKIMKERTKIKETMAQNLKNIGFDESEIQEVLSILDKCEKDVQEQKDLLIGTNINNDNTVEIMGATFDIIRTIELQAAADIKTKIAEIRKRKES